MAKEEEADDGQLSRRPRPRPSSVPSPSTQRPSYSLSPVSDLSLRLLPPSAAEEARDMDGDMERERDGAGDDGKTAVCQVRPDGPASDGGGGSPSSASAEEATILPPSSSPASPTVCGVRLLPWVSTCARVVLYSYNSFGLSLLTFFLCHSLGGGRGSRMVAYPSIDCDSAAYGHYRPALLACLVLIVFGAPFFLLAFLVRVHRRPQGRTVPPHSQSQSELVSLHAASLFSGAFRPPFRYYSVCILLRRAVLLCIFVFAPNAASVYPALTAANVTILTVHALCWPFRRPLDNWTETASLFVLCLQSSYMADHPPPFTDKTQAATSALLILLPAAALMATAAVSRWPRFATNVATYFAAWRAASVVRLVNSSEMSPQAALSSVKDDVEGGRAEAG